jgi:YD repeat-containing protein
MSLHFSAGATYVYDGNRVIATVVKDKNGNVVSTSSDTYDPNGNLLTAVDGDGNVTANVYDGNLLISTTVGYGTAAAATTTYAKNGVSSFFR